MRKDNWRDILGYEGFYKIRSNSSIVNSATNTVKKSSIQNNGYAVVDLFKYGRRTTFLVHRLVAQSFLSNPENKPCVNHKDGNKLNNHVSNLEWCTYSENIKHSYDKLGRIAGMKGKRNLNSKEVLMLNMKGKKIKSFKSIMEAERQTGIRNNGIVANLKGKSKSAGGFKWEYKINIAKK